jgi:peptidoglycan/xylan/chitin deacetylase (PgdA/CDA1 family)
MSDPMKNAVKAILVRSGLLNVAGRLRGRSAAILMFHSVMDNPQSAQLFLGEISHSRDIFRGQMELLAAKYHPVSLQQIQSFIRGHTDLSPRSIAITFDDGYLDNFEVAAPILKEVGVPATFYATVDCVEGHTLPWPSHLRFIFRTTTKPEWTDSRDRKWPLCNFAERENALLRSCDECARLAGTVQSEYVLRVGKELDTEVPAESGSMMMGYDQMKGLISQGHIVGSHTLSHPNMAHLNSEDVRRELVESKQRLERGLGTSVTHFSYPCPALSPHWTEETVVASHEAGYQTAVTTNDGLAQRSDSPLNLNRLRPSKTVQGLLWNLECAFAGRFS